MDKYYIKSINSDKIIYQGLFNQNLISSIIRNHLDDNLKDELEYGFINKDNNEPISTYKKINKFKDIQISGV